MATHSSILAWRIPWTEELVGLESIGLQRVRHDWEMNAFTFHFFGYIYEILTKFPRRSRRMNMDLDISFQK